MLTERHDGFFLGLKKNQVDSREGCDQAIIWNTRTLCLDFHVNLNQRAPTPYHHPNDRGGVAPSTALSRMTFYPNGLNTKACGVKLLCARVWRIIYY